MTEDQVGFFRDLCAPFPPSQVGVYSQGGKTLHYVGRGTLMNRLDDVAGPNGWTAEYRESREKGCFCALKIYVPDGHGGFEGITKEDCGGVAGMSDAGDNEKSGATSAFKRACEAWGIARYLRGEGVPAYLGEQELPPDVRPSRPAQQSQGQSQAPQQGQRQFDPFSIPKMGKALFPWAKKLEEHFNQTGVLDMLDEFKKANGLPYQFRDWPAEAVEDGAMEAARAISQWGNYNGEFDNVLGPQQQAPKANSQELDALRRTIADGVQKIIELQTGSKGDKAHVDQAIANISHECLGFRVSALSKLTDKAQLLKLWNAVADQIERKEQEQKTCAEDDLPQACFS